MKKLLLLLCLVMLICSLCACSGDADAENTEPVEESVTVDDVVNISFDKDEFVDYKKFIKESEGYEGVTCEEGDTTIVLTMDSASYAKLLEAKQKEAVEAYDKLVKEEGSYIEKFDYDDNFREVKCYVNRELYEAADVNTTMAVIELGGVALAYQQYHVHGKNTIISLIYADNEEVIATVKLPAELTQKTENE